LAEHRTGAAVVAECVASTTDSVPLVRVSDLRFLEDIHAVGKTHEWFRRLLHDYLGSLEDIHAAGEALQWLIALLGLGNRSAGEFHEQVHLLLGGIKELHQLLGDLLFGRCDEIRVKDLACADVVVGAVAVRADHGCTEVVLCSL